MDIAVLQERLQRAVGDELTAGPLLGEGGFAAVFRCREASLGRDVAIKVLDLDRSPDPSLAERFVREAQLIAQLEHPSIVPIYKVGRRTDVLYIVMRCVDGPSLRQVLEQNRRLSVSDAARIARQVADALAYAHGEGVVHRDIKPDNILIDHKTGVVLVTDFGIAKAAPAAKAARGRVKTPRHFLTVALKALLGVSAAGCLLAVAFAAGVVVMGWAVSGRAPRLVAAAPLPEPISEALRRRGALARGDTALLAFQPDQPGDSALLVIGRREVVVVGAGAGGTRRYGREAVIGYDNNLRWSGGPRFVVMLRVQGRAVVRRDTVYRALPVRAFWELAKRIDRALSTPVATVRVHARPPTPRPRRPRVRAR